MRTLIIAAIAAIIAGIGVVSVAQASIGSSGPYEHHVAEDNGQG
jgi:hypothetical protein